MAKKPPHSFTGGVKPMPIEGIHHHERDRVHWTDADREWRKQWMKDQVLHPDEPRRVPELEKATRNPIRRFFAMPSAMFYKFLEPKVGHHHAMNLRIAVPKLMGMIFIIYASYYHLKYNRTTWERHGGWEVLMVRPVVPGMKGYPAAIEEKEPSDYDNRFFKDRKTFL